MVKPSLSWYIFALRYTRWQRYAITVLFLSCCVAAWFWFSYTAFARKIKLLDAKIQEVQQKIQTASKKESSCSRHNSCDIITKLLHDSADNAISLASFEQKENPESGRLSVTMNLNGSFETILAFIQNIADTYSSVNIESYELTPSHEDGSLLSCLLIVSFYGERCANFT